MQSQLTTSKPFSGLAWVGMEKIQMPIRWETQALPAEVFVFVNLLPGKSRGIHMSRLYALITEELSQKNLSLELLERLTEKLIHSQDGISSASKIKVQFQLPMNRQALKSSLHGWRLYPAELEVVRFGSSTQKILRTEILYSSTCPASTALSAEVWKNEIQKKFGEEKNLSTDSILKWIENQQGMPATPHAQRSLAKLEVQVKSQDFGVEDLIEGLERVLKTPVQTFVKRVDEQEFARLNGQNPMFCEDSSRLIQDWLNSLDFVEAYRGVFEHLESLHPHNAVALIEKTNN